MSRWISLVAVVAAFALAAWAALHHRPWLTSIEAPPSSESPGEEAVTLLPTVHIEERTPYGTVEVDYDPGADPEKPNVRASCRCTLAHDDLGGTLGPIDVSAEGRWDGARFSGIVEAKGVKVEVDAEVSLPELAAGRYRLPGTEISTVYAAVASLVPESRKADIRGTIAGNGEFRLLPLRITFRPSVADFNVDGLVGPEYRMGSFTHMGRDNDGNLVPVPGGEGTAGWLPLADAGRMLPAAVISAEDASFRSHGGFSVESMTEAAHDNDVEGQVVRGGSTISQQLAKNLFLTPERTYARKLKELLYAVEMERELGKDRILELYLNVIEWGPTVRGARAAAEAYFLKQPLGLLPEEAAFMASIIRNPRGGWEKQYVGGRVQTRRLGWILENMVTLTPEERVAALARDVHFVPPKK
ncbi:MAG: transglycosylase domain-containing protein [Deltaproteobacteria bacterium]|nr:transglycosylase domain-containing protein [Deltaproteobacteria bacterium]